MFICLSVQNITEKLGNGFWLIFLVGVGHTPSYDWLDCCCNPVHDQNLRILLIDATQRCLLLLFAVG